MKNLSDNDFDDLFRRRVDEFEPGFDDTAWNAMESRLKKRDRVIFVQRAVFTLLFLMLLGGGGYLLLRQDPVAKSAIVKNKADDRKPSPAEQRQDTSAADGVQIAADHRISSQPLADKKPLVATHDKIRAENSTLPVPERRIQRLASTGQPALSGRQITAISTGGPAYHPIDGDISTLAIPALSAEKRTDRTRKNTVKTAGASPWSLTFSAGPDFSAVSALGGQHPKVQLGFLANYAVNKRLLFSTGARYGIKQYETSPFDYQLVRPDMQSSISYIDASCKVLEVPLRASYAVHSGRRGALAINAGLSSYFMLHERYAFDYTPESGRGEFILQKTNANQHLFGVAEVSATYTLKPKALPVQFGIEPYVKLPFSGVGEGRVRLHSIGVNLTVSYGFKKK